MTPLASQNANALANVDPKTVLERYLAEESTIDIAQSLGVTRSGLNYWLLRTAEDEWKNAQVVKALKRKEEAEEEIDTASDALTLARARERLRAAQWDLERVCRRIYGQDTPTNVSQVVVHIGTDLRAAQQTHDICTDDAQVIDAEHNAADSESVARQESGSVEGVGRVGK